MTPSPIQQQPDMKMVMSMEAKKVKLMKVNHNW